MRIGHWIIVVLIAGSLCGCTWLKERWPWRKKDVPVTPPAKTSAESGPSSAAPPEQASADSKRSEEPKVRPRGPTEPTGESKVTGGGKAPPQEPPAPGMPPLRLEQPVMVENVVPGAERIALVDTIRPPVPPPTASRHESLVKTAEPTTGPAVESTSSRPPEPTPVEHRPPVEALVKPPEPGTQPAAEPTPLRPQPPKPVIKPGVLKAPQELPPPETVVYGREEVVAASLIRVNDRFITVDDVLRGAREKLADLPATMGLRLFRNKVESILREEVRKQIIEFLVLAEAKRRLTEEQEKLIEEELQKRLRSMIAEVGGSRKKLEAVLVRRGTDLETVLADTRRRMTVESFLQNRFQPAISVTRQMLWRYYLKNKSRFTTDKQVQMQIIAAPYDRFLPEGGSNPSAEERRAAVARAKEIIDQAAAAVGSGEDFGEVARRLSRGIKARQGGIWPMMTAGSFRETKVEQAAFALKAGQVSEVIQTPRGYYIVKARRVRPGQTVGFEKAQEQIEKEIRDEQFQKLQQEYIEGLLAGAQIVQSEKFLQLAVDRAVRTYRRP